MTAAYSIPADGGDELDFSDVGELPEYLGHVRFRSCRFNSLSFLDTVLDHTVFEDCSLDFARIGDKIDGCAFLNCSFRYANLLGAQFVGCKMTGSDLSELGESSYSIQGGDWSYTLLSKLKIKNTTSTVCRSRRRIFMTAHLKIATCAESASTTQS